MVIDANVKENQEDHSSEGTAKCAQKEFDGAEAYTLTPTQCCTYKIWYSPPMPLVL